MPNESKVASIDDPQLLPFLPMLYVAWADGDLNPSEIRAISSRLEATDGIDEPRRRRLSRWLDPERPPSATELGGLLATIREAALSLPHRQRRTLTEFGLELAANANIEIPAAELAALEQLEEALGLSGAEATRQILEPDRPQAVTIDAEPTFDFTALRAILDGDQRAVRDWIKEILRRPEFAYVYGLGKDDYRDQVFSWAKSLAAEGVGSLTFPHEVGGSGDFGGFIAAFETLAFHDLSLLIKTGVQFGLFGGSILQLGTESHHQRYLRDVGSLALPGCFAMTETGHGSNVYDLETTARYDPESQEFVVHTPNTDARKDYIGNAACHGRLATVFAQLEVGGEQHGVHALLVPIRNEDGTICSGVGIEDCGEKLGLNGVDNGRLWFDRVRVPRENLLDRFAHVAADGTYTSPIASPAKRFFVMLGTLVGGRVSVALAGLSAAKLALAIAVRYGSRRRQFGPTGEAETVLLDYRTHQRRLMPRLATTYALDFALKYLVRRFLESDADDRREVEAMTAGLKAWATWHATDTIQVCREACGGQGYLAVNRLASLKSDTDVFTTFEGDNTVLLQLMTKSLLTGYQRQFAEMKLLGLARHVAGLAATAVGELNPVVKRRTDEDHLRDREFQLGALEWRRDHLLGTLARRLKRRLDDGMDSFHALIEVQDHAVALAKAHTEYLVLEQFDVAVTRCDNPSVAEMLKRLRDLFALARIEADRGWFLEQNYFEAPKAKAIRDLVNRRGLEVREQAVPLVDAFGIPDELLAAPIATRS